MKFKHFPSPALTISLGPGALCLKEDRTKGAGGHRPDLRGGGVLPSVPSWEPGSWRVEERCLRG